MATTPTPNMNLPVPVVGVEPGPQYAQDVNASLNILDGHNHTSGSGVPITPLAMNINSDLTTNGNRLTGLLSLTFTPQSVPLPGISPDLGALYVAGSDLYFNDEDGNQVRITQNGAVTGTPGSIANLAPPASASYVAADSTFVWQSDANTPAIMDMASLILRNLVVNSFGLSIFPPAAMGADYSIVMPTLPGSESFLTIDASGNELATIPKSQGITAANIANNTITQQQVAVGLGFVPTGAIIPYGSNIEPVGFLLCLGRSHLTADYEALYWSVGNAYGSSDGGITTATVTGGSNTITVASATGFAIGKHIRAVYNNIALFPIGTTITNVVGTTVTCSENALDNGTSAECHAATNFNEPASGLFIRGVDNGSGNDPNASSRITLATGGNTGDNPGSYQADQNLSHTHTDSGHTHQLLNHSAVGTPIGTTSTGVLESTTPTTGYLEGTSIQSGSANITASGGSQSNPRNMYAQYIIKT